MIDMVSSLVGACMDLATNTAATWVGAGVLVVVGAIAYFSEGHEQ